MYTGPTIRAESFAEDIDPVFECGTDPTAAAVHRWLAAASLATDLHHQSLARGNSPLKQRRLETSARAAQEAAIGDYLPEDVGTFTSNRGSKIVDDSRLVHRAQATGETPEARYRSTMDALCELALACDHDETIRANARTRRAA